MTDTTSLPPLPEPYHVITGLPHFCKDDPVFSAEQMQAYALAALAQSAQAPVVNDQLTTGRSPAQPAPSDPLQLMADDEKNLGLDDSVGAPLPGVQEAVEAVMKAADQYAHVYSFVGDDTMPKFRAALRSAVVALAAQAPKPAEPGAIEEEGMPGLLKAMKWAYGRFYVRGESDRDQREAYISDLENDLPVLFQTVDDLSTLVSRLVRALRQAAPNHTLPAQALDYLRRKGLTGSSLRVEALARGERHD